MQRDKTRLTRLRCGVMPNNVNTEIFENITYYDTITITMALSNKCFTGPHDPDYAKKRAVPEDYLKYPCYSRDQDEEEQESALQMNDLKVTIMDFLNSNSLSTPPDVKNSLNTEDQDEEDEKIVLKINDWKVTIKHFLHAYDLSVPPCLENPPNSDDQVDETRGPVKNTGELQVTIGHTLHSYELSTIAVPTVVEEEDLTCNLIATLRSYNGQNWTCNKTINLLPKADYTSSWTFKSNTEESYLQLGVCVNYFKNSCSTYATFFSPLVIFNLTSFDLDYRHCIPARSFANTRHKRGAKAVLMNYGTSKLAIRVDEGDDVLKPKCWANVSLEDDSTTCICRDGVLHRLRIICKNRPVPINRTELYIVLDKTETGIDY